MVVGLEYIATILYEEKGVRMGSQTNNYDCNVGTPSSGWEFQTYPLQF